MHRTYLTVIAILVAVILYLTIVPRTKGPQLPEPPATQPSSVAVLRFVALADAEADAFADCLLTAIAAGLRAAGIAVAVDSSSMTADGSTRAATEHLGAPHVLEGSVRPMSGSLQVGAQLVDSETDAHLWFQTYDVGVVDLSNVAGKIAADVISRVAPSNNAFEPSSTTASAPWVRSAWKYREEGTMSNEQVALETKGVTVNLLATVDLGPEIEGMAGRQLRMRMVTIEPGGVFGPVHDHRDRPGTAYILQGTITDHRNGVATDYGPGVGWPEDRNTTHWLENRGTIPAVEISVDIVRQQ